MTGTALDAICFYLPQFHPIPENDAWWGRGFTEWRNVVKARPLFPGHYQPHLPADMGFYDLRLDETRQAQADLAREYGIRGFCYYHYWFNGRRVLEKPFQSVLSSRRPDLPFCLCWANESWTRAWDGNERQILLQQNYSAEDDIAHLRALLPAFEDERYIKVDGKPVFLVYRAARFPDAVATTDRWRREAEKAGLPGIFLLRVESFPDETGDPRTSGFDAAVEFQPRWWDLQGLRVLRRRWWHRRRLKMGESAYWRHNIYNYDDVVLQALERALPDYPLIRCASPSWDNSARRAGNALIIHESNPNSYERWLRELVGQAAGSFRRAGLDRPMVFINAWNEWAEGNHLEPCQKWGLAYLEATRKCLLAVAAPA